MSRVSVHPVLKTKTKEDQTVVDEILQVVADQGCRMSLSSTDYQFTKDISTRSSPTYNRINSRCSLDSSNASTISSTEFSYSPPSTQESAYTSLSEGTGKDFLRKHRSTNEESCKNGFRMSKLPPLDPQKIRRPSRPSPQRQSPIHEISNEEISNGRLVRPKSAHGQRTISNRHRTVNIN